ncbi:nitrilase-related carbon-nitrogen hydrolase [Pseudonocardia sp. NPDC046786]|uniref:nitrilase-related carbon-nitrogen hydrolase n=1 Tax=Pseudonocardia sp. NPDC046786 TaxID=3155471 RepID=UPI003403E9EC
MSFEVGDGGTVGVVVVNQLVPTVRTRTDARLSYFRTAGVVSGLAGAYRADLVVLPEYGVHGIGTGTGERPALAFPEEALDVLGPACAAAGVWLAVSVSAGATRDDPSHRMVLLDDRGTVVAGHVSGPAGGDAARRPRIVDGPGGLRTALAFADGPRPALTDPGLREAELVILCWTAPGAGPSRIVQAARGLAWTNGCYVASANAAGTVGSRQWVGHSSLVGHDGRVLGLCGGIDYEVQHAEFSVPGLRAARSRRADAGRAVADSVRRGSLSRLAAARGSHTPGSIPGKADTYVR